jgi:hypothetical protein
VAKLKAAEAAAAETGDEGRHGDCPDGGHERSLERQEPQAKTIGGTGGAGEGFGPLLASLLSDSGCFQPAPGASDGEAEAAGDEDGSEQLHEQRWEPWDAGRWRM